MQADVLEQFLRVKYAISMSFINLLKKHGHDKRKTQNRNMQMRSHLHIAVLRFCLLLGVSRGFDIFPR